MTTANRRPNGFEVVDNHCRRVEAEEAAESARVAADDRAQRRVSCPWCRSPAGWPCVDVRPGELPPPSVSIRWRRRMHSVRRHLEQDNAADSREMADALRDFGMPRGVCR
jgi:hypothetical protein